MAELKSFPFCGGKAYLERSHRAFIGGRSSKVDFHGVYTAEGARWKVNLE